MNLNDERTALGHQALNRFAELTSRSGVALDEVTLEEARLEEVLCDLLVALRHSATSTGVDFDETDNRAEEFYRLSLVAPNGAVSDLPTVS